jgi:hypothetical protein
MISITAVIFGAVKLADSLADSGKVATKCDSGQHQTYEMEIKNSSFSPAYINANRCDTMIIKNLDDWGRLIAFGKHDHHTAYGGTTERYLLKNEELKITLDKAGTYLVHDHNQDEVQATFHVGG